CLICASVYRMSFSVLLDTFDYKRKEPERGHFFKVSISRVTVHDELVRDFLFIASILHCAFGAPKYGVPDVINLSMFFP
ncbi:hypothetical protein M3201_24875, partial [Paenibacillus motobuensis]|uniref:hypothetical protein n=1 Tax=Paenibacillus TaxID=44249 RepID=UPI00203D464A